MFANPAITTLQDVFRDIAVLEFSGEKRTAVSGLITDSRRVIPGSVFFAVQGLKINGELFIEDAIARGAAAVVSSGSGGTRLPVPFIRVENVRKTIAAAARNFYGNPGEKLQILGVTGTNGKTTVTTLLHYLMEKNGTRWGLIGTVRYGIGARSLPSHRTTPEAPDLYAMLAQMRANDCAGVAMEVSSHAIAQDRVDGLEFAALAFTNLSRDHMDYHGDMENYFQAKARPFLGKLGEAPKYAAINIDDTAGNRLAKMLPPEVNLISFGTDERAIIRATDIEMTPLGSAFTLVSPQFRGVVKTTLPGHYNISNVLCALALAYAAGRDLSELAPAVEKFPGVPGRMERVAPEVPFQIYVDYAHTDDALKNALLMLRKITPAKLLVIFGCGGNRDRGKRAKMTAVVQEYADFAWATADNPRKESLEEIFADMNGGVISPEKIAFVADRRQAISRALDVARAGDCLLIAGKGHETYQEFADVTVPFDDRQVTRELIALKQCRPNL